MIIRHKITLLITAAGFLSSLLLSCIVLWEMFEQQLEIIDLELQSMARRAVHVVSKNDKSRPLDASSLIDDEGYWLAIYNEDYDKPIYLSHLAKLIKIKEPALNSSATLNLIIPADTVDLRQNEQNDVPFRIKNFKISYSEKTFLVTVGRPMEELEEELWGVFIMVINGLVFSVIILLVISYFFAGFILKPIRIMNEQALEISENHLDRRLPITESYDEFNALAQTLNQVFDRLQHAFMRQKRLLADASHELKTPLSIMKLAIEGQLSTQDKIQNERHMEGLKRLTEQVLRMERLVKNILDLSALEIQISAIKESIDLVKILERLIADYSLFAEARNIRLEVKLPQQLIVQGNEEQLSRVLSNILDNSIKYNVDGGQVRVIGYQSVTEVIVKVENTGTGVDAEESSKVFEPFYRVEKSRSTRYGGTGLGLSIVKRIVELHQGKVSLESQNGWTKVTVSLPLIQENIPKVY